MTSQEPSFQWKCQPKAESLATRFLEESINLSPSIAELQQALLDQTSTRLFDWLDHLIVGTDPRLERELEEAGYIEEETTPAYRVYLHPGAQLPRIVVGNQQGSVLGIAVSVESIADFLMVRGIKRKIEGSPFACYRRCCVSTENDISLWVVERRGTTTMEPTYYGNGYLEKYFQSVEKWLARPRNLENGDESMARSILLAQELIEDLGKNLAAWVVLECERKYWQSKNTAGQYQKNRQDRLGMGWANHDHHTFRSSRYHFTRLVHLFELLGFHCRERYYTGKEAGWGAQVMENPDCRLVLFLDVDLTPEEVDVDFAHQVIPEVDRLGTIGLWCALHGDSILGGGMHHLEAQFMFDELSRDLDEHGIKMMEPFSSFPYLRQAFTQGEVWPVDPARLEKLLIEEKISKEQADKFLAEGAIGSHLENLQRREGYKGFNQKNVSVIIKKTDPRSISI